MDVRGANFRLESAPFTLRRILTSGQFGGIGQLRAVQYAEHAAEEFHILR